MFRGIFEHRVEEDRRVRIPIKFREEMESFSKKTPMKSRLVLIPLHDNISIVPFPTFTKDSRSWKELQEVIWDPEVNYVVSQNVIHPCQPLFQRHHLSPKIQNAISLFKREQSLSQAVLSKLSGTDFEKFIAEVFSSVGIEVQMNVRLVGAEIDMMLLQVAHEGCMHYSIVECKHRSTGKHLVGIGEVMRLYGLSEALRRQDMSIKHKIIVASTGYTSPARLFSRISDVDLLVYDSLLDWIKQNNLRPNSEHAPFFRFGTMDQRGRLRLPKPLASYLRLDTGSPAIMLGVMDIIEIWNSKDWERKIAMAPSPEELSAKLRGLGIY